MNQEPKNKEKPKTNNKVEVQDLEPRKDPKGGFLAVLINEQPSPPPPPPTHK